MRAVQLSMHVKLGGAGRAATRLHLGLRAHGVDSRFATTSFDECTGIPNASPLVIGARRRAALDVSSFARFAGLGELEGTLWHAITGSVPRLADHADVVHLHWVEGMLRAPEVFERLARRVPIVWTLHDAAPFTGGCSYPRDCERFTKACGSCPQTASPARFDVSYRTLARRRRAYRSYPDVVLSPSRWLADIARRSTAFRDHDVRHVRNGLDLDLFKPGSRIAARELLGLPADKRVVAFLAANPTHKGSGQLVRALGHLRADGGWPADALLVFAGAVPLEDAPVPTRYLGLLHDEVTVAALVRAADLLVTPSEFDNIPNTIMEALASTTPVVGFDVGGVGEGVIDGETGALVPAGDTRAFAAALARLLSDAALRARLGAGGRAHAERCFDLRQQSAKVAEIYDEVVGAQRA